MSTSSPVSPHLLSSSSRASLHLRLLALLALVAVASAGSDLTIFSMGCSGRVDILSGLPYSIVADLSKQKALLQAAYKKTRERIRCHCPEVTDEQFKDRFSPARIVFNLLGGSVEFEEVIPCLDKQEQYTRDLHKYISALLRGSEVTLPESCSRAQFMGEEGCRVEVNLQEEMGVNLRVAAAECPDSVVPGFGVWCAGEGCRSLFRPCSLASGCAEGQECMVGSTGVEAFVGDAFAGLSTVVQRFFNVNVTASVEHLYRLVDGSIDSDRTLDDCDEVFSAFPGTFLSKLAEALTGTPNLPGICLPNGWKGVGSVVEAYYGRWEKMSGMPRKDECAPLKPRSDSQFNWRRGQLTDNGISGGGWCVGYNDCNFHLNAGDCESNDDFEYFMGKLYCKYKQKDSCLSYAPYCWWNTKAEGRHKCKFNHTTQDDGIPDGNWKLGLNCAKIDELASKCQAAQTPSASCEEEFCACSGGKWDATDESCDAGSEKKQCSNMVECWGALQQCYEKMGEDSPYMRTATACESFFLCRCHEVALAHGCDPKKFCGRRCACMHSERDRFIGPHCDIRLVRGTQPTLFTFDPADGRPEPVALWDGKLSDGRKAAGVLRSISVPGSMANPKQSPHAEPVVVTSCDGRVWLFPTAPFGVALWFRGLDAVASAAASAAIASFRCAIDGVASDDTDALRQMAESYFMHTPQMWYRRFFAGGDFLKATLADFVFNTSGEAEPAVPALEHIAHEAQEALSGGSREASAGGWVPHLFVWMANGYSTLTSTLSSASRALDWLAADSWYLPLLEMQSIENEEERNQKIRTFLQERQQKVAAEQLEEKGYKRSGKVVAPQGSASPTVLGVSLPLGRAGAVEGYLAQCEAQGMAEVQIGVGGPTADALLLRTPCSSNDDCSVVKGATCMEIETTVFQAPLYDVDFLGGFLWGGNFTKGFIGGCPILSTTVNQAAFETVKDECHGVKKWVSELSALFTEGTGTLVEEGSKPSWCHVGRTQLLSLATGGAKDDEAIDLSQARPLSKRPFALPAAEEKKKEQQAGHDDEL